jgi:ring-1,2-phenylacetyl-CoA epoxidase subunit PaaD
MVSTPNTEQVWQALAQVPDPEIPVVNVVEMGIVRGVRLEGGKATVTMTPTFSGCPALHAIRESLEQAVRGLGFAEVEVRTVLSPPWSTDWITPEAREKLERYGIAPPRPTSDLGLIQLEPEPLRCPRCGSLDTAVKNTFGSTLCKSIYVCKACGEPFEGFKTV